MSPAPSSASLNETITFLCSFRHEVDGSWVCVKQTRIPGRPESSIRPGMTFRYGERHFGRDVAEELERLGSSFGS